MSSRLRSGVPLRKASLIWGFNVRSSSWRGAGSPCHSSSACAANAVDTGFRNGSRFAGLHSKPVSPSAFWNVASCAASHSAQARLSGTSAAPRGVQARAQKLREHVRARKFTGGVAEVMRHYVDTLRERGGTAGIATAGKQALQKIAEGVQTIDHLMAIGVAGRKSRYVASDCSRDAFVGGAASCVARHLEEVPPGHRGLELIASGAPRPAERIAVERCFGGVARGWGGDRPPYWRNRASSMRPLRSRHRGNSCSRVALHTCQQSADDNAAIEEE